MNCSGNWENVRIMKNNFHSLKESQAGNTKKKKKKPPQILSLLCPILWFLMIAACCPESFAKGCTKVKTTEITQATNFQKRDTQEGNLLMEQKLVTVKRGKAESES